MFALSLVVVEEDIQSVDDTGNVTQDGEQDVDAEVSTASSLQEDTDGWQDDGKNDLEDIASGEGHFDDCLCLT